MKAREGVWERQTERGCARRGGEATVRVTEDRSGATVVPAAPLDPIAHTHPLSICVRSAYYGCNVRGYAVIPGVGTSAMPVASVPSIKSYIHQQKSYIRGAVGSFL